MKIHCKVLTYGEWNDAVWSRRIRRSGGRVWHEVRYTAKDREGNDIEIPRCGLWVHRSQIKELDWSQIKSQLKPHKKPETWSSMINTP